MSSTSSSTGASLQLTSGQRLAPSSTGAHASAAPARAAASKPPVQQSPTPHRSNRQQEPGVEELQRAADELQMRVTQLAPELQFSVDQSSGKSIIKFTDRKTNEVIQQFPSKEVLDLIKELDNFQRGLLLNRKA